MKKFESPTGRAEIYEPGDDIEPTPDGKAYSDEQARAIAAIAVIENKHKAEFDTELAKAKAAKVQVPWATVAAKVGK